jgi:predicted RNase H-like nuclease (RuvC/YqgF family)
MSNRRVVQHRQQREANTREVAELKQEIVSLKRQLARAHREVERLKGIAEPEEAQEKSEDAPTCPKCKSQDLGRLETPAGNTYTVCRSCKHRQRRA